MEIGEIARRTDQELMPEKVNGEMLQNKEYGLYPFHSLGSGKINKGYESLAKWIGSNKNVKIDGYVGVDWVGFKKHLDVFFRKEGLRVNWLSVQDFLKPKQEIDLLVAPWLGAKDSVWGKNTTLLLSDFYQAEKLKAVKIDPGFDLNIIIGVGAALAGQDLSLIYLDLPKNELLYRMRAASILNLGNDEVEDKVSMYKRFYFVDWVVLNKHKEQQLSKASVLVDTQWNDTISWTFANDLFEGIKKISTSVFRARPWFDPGVWGGQWMKEHFQALSRAEENFAWSFEIIAPENGLVFESDGNLLEVSFDTLMFKESAAVLGRHAQRFGNYFPVRFDFLDTFDGGNLSIQCHPSVEYIQENFGEEQTQDETYYMLDCAPDALVYLGFNEDINPAEFRNALEQSVANETELAVEKYIQTFSPKKHDLFLIPNKTVHSSGKNNMVLEISATPYIFTFKMYDWLQKDDLGKPRPINIEHAFNNLDFDRKGERIEKEFISKPAVLDEGADWKLIHLPTHAEHYYDVHRLDFETEVKVETEDVCHVLMLVEGTAIEVETNDGTKVGFNYAETFIIPAAAKSYTLKNQGKGTAKVVKAFVKYKNYQDEKD